MYTLISRTSVEVVALFQKKEVSCQLDLEPIIKTLAEFFQTRVKANYAH